jgi:hypothetical protein
MMHFFLRTERNVGHGYGKKGKKSKMGCHKMKLQKWEILPLKRVKNKREMVNCYPDDLCLSVRPLGPPQCNIFYVQALWFTPIFLQKPLKKCHFPKMTLYKHRRNRFYKNVIFFT